MGDMDQFSETNPALFRLNNAQRRHLAGTLRIIAVAEFGYMGYSIGIKDSAWILFVIGVALFFILEASSLRLLRGVSE